MRSGITNMCGWDVELTEAGGALGGAIGIKVMFFEWTVAGGRRAKLRRTVLR